MNNRPVSLSVFFPAYNEAHTIEKAVTKAITAVKELVDTYEIIIVNDGSTDNTGTISDRLAEIHESVRVVHHEKNQGYGAAVWTGIQSAQHDYVFFTDADLQFDLSELALLLPFAEEYKAVLGYRAKRNDPLIRLINAKIWNIANRILFGLRVCDIDCAFKLLDRKLVAGLPLQTRGAMMSAEMLIHLQHRGVAFKEIPVTHFPRTQGTATGAHPRVIARAVRDLVSLYRGQLGRVSRIQLIRFAAVGVLNTAIDIGLYFILTRSSEFFAAHLLVAKAFSFGAGTLSSFFGNRAWTFNNVSRIRYGELVRFYLTVGIGMGINIATLSACISLFNIPDSIGVIIATAVTFVWNFVASKLWVYSGSKHGTL
ncbi:MAG TPA: bifunctional glycosyltransferase family 2/GtrA family protein [Candidatus Paceibacterota bacterium]